MKNDKLKTIIKEISVEISEYKQPDYDEILKDCISEYRKIFEERHPGLKLSILRIDSFISGFNEGITIGLKESLKWYDEMRKFK